VFEMTNSNSDKSDPTQKIGDGVVRGHTSDQSRKKTLTTQELFDKLDEFNFEPFFLDRNQPEAPKRDIFE
jgi:hypothetical protein